MTEGIKAAEERYVRDLTAENTELRKKLCELSDVIAEIETTLNSDIEVRRGTVVFL